MERKSRAQHEVEFFDRFVAEHGDYDVLGDGAGGGEKLVVVAAGDFEAKAADASGQPTR